jgi:hypothetical protein
MALPDLFIKQGSLACLQPANIQQLGVKHETADEKPQLLQRFVCSCVIASPPHARSAVPEQQQYVQTNKEVNINSYCVCKLVCDAG